MWPVFDAWTVPEVPGRYDETGVKLVVLRPRSWQVWPPLAGSWFSEEPNALEAAWAPAGTSAAAAAAVVRAARAERRVVRNIAGLLGNGGDRDKREVPRDPPP